MFGSHQSPPFPLPLLTDAYKLTHSALYPDASIMSAYGEFRASFERDPHDHRIVFYGIRYIIENYIARKWTLDDLDRAEQFSSTFNIAQTPFPFPRALFEKFITENDGYFPVKIEALREGSVVYPHVPVFQVVARGEYSVLATYLETVLTMLWYPSTVATLSRRSKAVISQYFDETVDDNSQFLLSSRLHDFGFRGCTCVEQAVIGGTAHLLNFEGTDTLCAAYIAQYNLNGGKPVGSSIPATEHSVMTAFRTEREAVLKTLEVYGAGTVSVVLDSYDYGKALSQLLPLVGQFKLSQGDSGVFVIRPDSGDQVEAVLMGLSAGEAVFGTTINSKGYKVIKGCAVIQGDAVTPFSLAAILERVKAAGFSAQNVAFGMGGGLLQKVNRDTMSFATKLSMAVGRDDGSMRNIMKVPTSDSGKTSLPGALVVISGDGGVPTVYPKYNIATAREIEYPGLENLLQTVYDCGPVKGLEWDTFDTIRSRVEHQWASLPPIPPTSVISQELEILKSTFIQEQKKQQQ